MSEQTIEQLQAQIADLRAVLNQREARISMLEERLAAVRQLLAWNPSDINAQLETLAKTIF